LPGDRTSFFEQRRQTLPNKIKRLERIERLKKRMHEIAQWRQAAAAQEKEKLGAAHAEMIEALSGDGLMAYGPPAAVGARRVRGIERQIAHVEAVEKKLAERTLEEGRLAKLADRWLDSARDARREMIDRRTLEELVEATLRPDTGSRKP
jgi:hypothetical protein